MDIAPRGILNDFDHAASVDMYGRVRPTRRPRGTVTFMTCDLLDQYAAKEVKAHLYCHNVESFFYIFISAVTRYDLKTSSRTRKHPLTPWNSLEKVNNINFKEKFAT